MRVRYALTPQMAEYDRLEQSWVPYLMYFHNPCYSSSTVNTDSRGFRITHKVGGIIGDFDHIGNRMVNLLCGGSLAFGVGATSDAMTIPSILSGMTGQLWLNFGGRAFNSTQEFLLFLFHRRHLKDIGNIIVLSGINNLILHYAAGSTFDEFGPFFFSLQYRQAMCQTALPFRKRLARFAFGRRAESKHNQHHFCCGDTKEHILDILKRDIAHWKIFCDAQGIKIFYALQPFANWTNKKLSKEEEALFAELDLNPQNHFRVLKDKINLELYQWFASSLKEVCETNAVRFLDVNACLSKCIPDKEWIFVDRAHLNDAGNRYVAQALLDNLGLK